MNQQKVNAPFFVAMHPEKFAKRLSKFWRKEGRIDMKLENYRPVRPADADPESVQHSRLPRNPGYPGAVCGTHDCDAA